MVRSDEKNSKVSDLVDRYDQEALTSSLPNAFAPFLDSNFKPPVAASGANSGTKSVDRMLKS